MSKEFDYDKCACRTKEEMGGHFGERVLDVFYIAHPDHLPEDPPSEEMDEETYEEMEAYWDEYEENKIRHEVIERWVGYFCPHHEDAMFVQCQYIINGRFVFDCPQKAWEFVRNTYGKLPGFYWQSDNRDDDWRREQAMQAGMAFGCDGYNDAMGY